MSTLVAVGLLSVSAPSLAAYVTIEAKLNDFTGGWSGFTAGFNDTNGDKILTISELDSFSGVYESSVPPILFPNLVAFGSTMPSDLVPGYSLQGTALENAWLFGGAVLGNGDPAPNVGRGTENWDYGASVSAVPLPAAAWLLLSGLGGLGFLGRRRKPA